MGFLILGNLKVIVAATIWYNPVVVVVLVALVVVVVVVEATKSDQPEWSGLGSCIALLNSCIHTLKKLGNVGDTKCSC